MPSHLSHLICAGLAASLVAAAPAPSRVSELVKKSSSTCTFTSAASASESKSSCSTIVLQDIEVPAGETLDLTDLNDGTKVRGVSSAREAISDNS
jgi:polygalacturonase